MNKQKIGVIGLGRLGICLVALLAQRFRVRGVDISSQRLQQILNREGFYEPRLNEYLEAGRHSLTVSLSYQTLRDCDIVFILTQTPSLESGKFDLQYVESALRQLHDVNPRCLAVVSSTINIGDMDTFKTIHQRIVYNPEFIKQGSIIHDFENPKFVLIGAYTKEDGDQLAKIWKTFHDKPICVVNPVEAEIIKLSLNMSFTLGITFANMIGDVCQKFNVDSSKILDIIYQDRRNYKSGLGFMGLCFPRDIEAFKHASYSANKFVKLVRNLNNHIVEKCLEEIKRNNKKKIGILGVSYKPNVPYIDESQPLKIAYALSKEGYEVYIYDNLAEENAKQVLPNAHFCLSASECVEHADVIFVGTINHSNLKTVKPVVNPWK